VKNIKNLSSFSVVFFLALSSFLISYTYYFDHYAVGNALILNNSQIYNDKTNLFFLINSNSPSFLFIIINFFIKIGFSTYFTNTLLTFISTLLNLSGIYLISKFITSSAFFSLLISLTAVVLQKNFGNIDYPTLMFSPHTNGLIAYSLCTFIFGLLTLRNLSFAILLSLLLLSIHLIIGLWIFGIIILTLIFTIEKKEIKQTLFIFSGLLIVFLFYVHSYTNYIEIPFEFNQKDYDDYFLYIEAHRNNMGNLGNMYFDYVLKSLILLVFLILHLKYNSSNTINNNNLFLKIVCLSIIFSGIIYFAYKTLPQIFPEIAIRTIPQRFFLIHSIIGYPLIIAIISKFLEKFFIKRNLNKNYSFRLISIILVLHLIQQSDTLKLRFQNIQIIKNDKIEEQLFWSKFKDIYLDGYILTSNYLCNKTIIYAQKPLLFCFEGLDYIPYLPKFASPTQKITKQILGISYSDVKQRNIGGISEIEVKKIYENKTIKEWKIIKNELNVNTIVVPKEWNLKIDNLIINSKYKVYLIK
jgi:hypothetical protein